MCESSPMEQRISLITLGVADLGRARAFYEKLGWKASSISNDAVTFFDANGVVFGLWSRQQLAEDSAVKDGGGWGGVTLAHNLRSREEVDALLDAARAAGARIGREAGPTFYGGYSGIFVDLDGHPWEIAHNPGFKLAADGRVELP
jgi:predicted lactoylglutathione lyase